MMNANCSKWRSVVIIFINPTVKDLIYMYNREERDMGSARRIRRNLRKIHPHKDEAIPRGEKYLKYYELCIRAKSL